MSSVLALWVEFVYVFKRRHHRVTYSLCDGSLIPAVVHQKYIRKQIQIHFARERDVGACNRASASYTTTKFCNNITFIASTLYFHTHAYFHAHLSRCRRICLVAFASASRNQGCSHLGTPKRLASLCVASHARSHGLRVRQTRGVRRSRHARRTSRARAPSR